MVWVMRMGVFIALMAGAAVATTGCGDSTPKTAAVSDGTRITSALASRDVHSVKCMGSDEYGPGQEVPERPVMKRTAGAAIFDTDTRSHLWRQTDLWVAKAPLYVKIGDAPVEIAVIDDGGPRSRLQYSEGGEPNDGNTGTRVRFLPCGDKEPTWRGYAGAVISDAEPGCVRVAVKAPGEDPSVSAIPLNSACS